MFKLVIPGNTPSLKNSKQLYKNKATGQMFVTSSGTHKKWRPQALEALVQSPLVDKVWKYPLKISFHFIRDSRRRFDYINVMQAPLDLLIEAKIIEDDDMNHVIPGECSYQVRKGAACCILTIEETNGNSFH